MMRYTAKPRNGGSRTDCRRGGRYAGRFHDEGAHGRGDGGGARAARVRAGGRARRRAGFGDDVAGAVARGRHAVSRVRQRIGHGGDAHAMGVVQAFARFGRRGSCRGAHGVRHRACCADGRQLPAVAELVRPLSQSSFMGMGSCDLHAVQRACPRFADILGARQQRAVGAALVQTGPRRACVRPGGMGARCKRRP